MWMQPWGMLLCFKTSLWSELILGKCVLTTELLHFYSSQVPSLQSLVISSLFHHGVCLTNEFRRPNNIKTGNTYLQIMLFFLSLLIRKNSADFLFGTASGQGKEIKY